MVGDRIEISSVGGSKFVVGTVERVDPMRTIIRTDSCMPITIPNKVSPSVLPSDLPLVLPCVLVLMLPFALVLPLSFALDIACMLPPAPTLPYTGAPVLALNCVLSPSSVTGLWLCPGPSLSPDLAFSPSPVTSPCIVLTWSQITHTPLVPRAPAPVLFTLVAQALLDGFLSMLQ